MQRRHLCHHQCPTNPAIRRLTLAELKNRRDKGLCYNCDEKFGPGHHCKKLFLIEGSWSDDEEDDGKVLEEIEEKGEEENETVGISLHAIAGTQAPQTMWVRGYMGKKMITILVDLGSTHNFLSERVARRLRLQPKNDGRLQVTVASGVRLINLGKCLGVRVVLQGITITVDFYILPLEGYDAVLGAQWLMTLGPILWDFSKMQMKFSMEGKEVMLQGMSTPSKFVDEEDMRRELKKRKQGVLLQLYAITPVDQQPQDLTHGTKEDERLQKILASFGDLFAQPKQLPPTRSHDHKIPLILGKGPVCVRPYHYPHIQKTEIKRMALDMLASGVIRPSNSPYLSPIILVRKSDGSWRFCIDYRALNQITMKDKFPIPVIDELFDELHGACYFSKLDFIIEVPSNPHASK